MRYMDEVVEPHILLYFQQFEDLPFQQDNIRSHIVKISLTHYY